MDNSSFSEKYLENQKLEEIMEDSFLNSSNAFDISSRSSQDDKFSTEEDKVKGFEEF